MNFIRYEWQRSIISQNKICISKQNNIYMNEKIFIDVLNVVDVLC